MGYFAFSLAEAGAIFNPDELEYALEEGRPILLVEDPKAHLTFMRERLPSLSLEENGDARRIAIALRDFSPQIFLYSNRKHWIEKTARSLRDGNCSELHICQPDSTLSPQEVYSEVLCSRYTSPLYEPPERSRAPLTAKPFQPLDWTTVARDEFVYGLHRQIGIVSGTIAEGGRGKSTLTLTEAVAIATGKDLLGRGAVRPQRVLYYNLEEGLLSLQKKVEAILSAYRLTPSDLEGRLFLHSGLSHDGKLRMAESQGSSAVLTDHGVALQDMINAAGIRVLILDPFKSCHALPENDNSAVDLVVKEFARIADEERISIELVHHVSKLGGAQATADSARGASAFKDAVRSLRVLNAPTPQDLELLERESPSGLVTVKVGKSNIARIGATEYFDLASIALPNGDERGVIRRATVPNPLDAFTQSAFVSCVAELSERPHRADFRSPDWAGHVLTRHASMKDAKTSPASRKWAEKVIAIWIRNGLLVEGMQRTERGKEQSTLTVNREKIEVHNAE